MSSFLSSRDPVDPIASQLPAMRLVRSHGGARRLAKMLGLLFLVMLVVLAVVPWQQAVNGAGRVMAYTPLERQQTIQATLEGRIARWWVQEGSQVRAGEKLVQITDNDPRIIERLDAEREAVRNRLEGSRQRAVTIQERVESLRASRSLGVDAASSRVQMAVNRKRSAEQTLDAAKAALRAAHLNLERQQQLLAEGLTSRRAVELAELEEAQRRTDLDKAQAGIDAAQNEWLALRADRGKVGTDIAAGIGSARADQTKALEDVSYAEAELTRIEVRLSRQQSQVIHAPRDGTVLRLLAGEGAEMVKTGDPLLVLVPDTVQRAVELWVDGNDVPLISAGRHVRLQFEGWPAIQFSGWPSVAVGTFGGKVAFVDAADNGQGDFRIVVIPDETDEPWPEGRFLRQGVRAKGWVLLGQVRLWYEVWRNFNGFPPMVLPDPEGQATKAKDAAKSASGASDKVGEDQK